MLNVKPQDVKLDIHLWSYRKLVHLQSPPHHVQQDNIIIIMLVQIAELILSYAQILFAINVTHLKMSIEKALI